MELRLFPWLISFFFISFSLSAQEDEIRWVPLDVPQLSESEFIWLDELTKSPYSSRYSEAVGFIGREIYRGEISAADRAAVQILKRISLSPYSVIQSGQQNPGATVEVRQQAVRLLGYIGGEYSLAAIDEILRDERDPVVLSSVFFVYAEIAPPFNEFRSSSFASLLRFLRRNQEGRVAIGQMLTAISNMHRRTFSMEDPELFAEILEVARSGYNSSVKRQALDLARLIAGVEIDPPQ